MRVFDAPCRQQCGWRDVLFEKTRRMQMMSAVWRSLLHTPALPSDVAVGKKLLEGIQHALLEAFRTHKAKQNGRSHALTPEEIEPIKALCDQLLPEHFQLKVPEAQGKNGTSTATSPRSRPRRNRVRYQHIWEDATFSMGIFVLPPGASIPLHDHPEMSVISRVLYGRLHVKSCDIVTPNQEDESSSTRHVAQIYKDEVVTAPYTTELLPNRGNLHEFVADDELGCAIFDILTPPYEPEDGRDCTYFRIVGDTITNEDGKRFVKLEAFEPENFEVGSEPYQGPRLTWF
ncbi:hypothetical protein Poli38472_000344 [Pythium oligandrum]|uniref:Uncharacterized protein n=1 Tax=Pythium oligandrum TaxID=41045 RepID=A0A8K1FI05_PYTOL|nr:hypothetical protein Poli38472_000344 [Pythium oligandrum]|eukprot:TMW60302.1 hypothetical protein Poli38472_000344 [Pythium oligandrum]